jgi:PhoH-like ATPase
LRLLDSNISISGIRPKNNGGPNWQQITAMHFLTDPDISAVFLQGGAGTGKTLLALAAGLHQKRQKKFEQIIIVRPTVHLSDDDNLGYLPGDINDKMLPWLLSIKQNLNVINPPKKKSSSEEEEMSGMSLLTKNDIEVQPLGFIRGSSFPKCFIIVEEAQNLSRHVIRTILTRPAEGTKIVFTGDLSQTDRGRFNKDSSGLAYAISKMRNNPIVGVVVFEQTLRSPLASLAERIL